jgi:hypothetical protein
MVAPVAIGAIFEIGSKLIDKFFPDPAAKAKAQQDLWKMQQDGEFKEMEVALQRDLAQIEVNKVEASSESLFKSGWRPAVGWVGVCGLAYNYLVQPLLTWYSSNHAMASPPSPDLGDLFIMLGGLLGLGTLRSFEKTKGVHK